LVRMTSPYRKDPRKRLRVLEVLNGHVMATCRDAKGRISYVCIHCGREQVPVTYGSEVSRRASDGIPLDPCPAVIADEAPWQEEAQGWFEVGDQDRRPVQERAVGYELWSRRRARENSRNS
jgi:hypothetical protein